MAASSVHGQRATEAPRCPGAARGLRALLPFLALASALGQSTAATIPDASSFLPEAAVRRHGPHPASFQNSSSPQHILARARMGLARGQSLPTAHRVLSEEGDAGSGGGGGGAPREWPREMLGRHEWSDYVGPVRIRNQGVPSCYGVRSHPGKEPQKVIADADVSTNDIRRMETGFSAQGEGYSGPRVMIWVAKNGLGNVVRGFLTTFFYALLSGRQLVRSEEGSHGKVMRSLCHGFWCPYINRLHHQGHLPRSTLNICHHSLGSSLRDPRPVMVGDCDVLLRFWASNETQRRCVLDTFG